MKAPRVNVMIDRLVLRGFAAEQRDAIAEGLRAELHRQFSDPAVAGNFSTGRSVASIRAKPIALSASAKPAQTGVKAARSMIGSIRS
jgi:hypothetical protein